MTNHRLQIADSHPVFTIGHSTRPIATFLRLLMAHGVTQLVDVRRFPASRTNPQFNSGALEKSLAEVHITYRHMPGLGGRRRPRKDSINTGWAHESFRGYADYMHTAAFAREIERVVRYASKDRVALMCAEAVPWRCHRSLIADALVIRGMDVREISSGVRATPHALTAFAKVDGDRIVYRLRMTSFRRRRCDA
jgi:uncharacterized protein (DUF488 family)